MLCVLAFLLPVFGETELEADIAAFHNLQKNKTWHLEQHEHATKFHKLLASLFDKADQDTTTKHLMSMQTGKLRIVNGGSEPMWMNYQAKAQYWPQTLRINPGQAYDYNIPGGMIPGTRFWPKSGCDYAGHNCAFGESGGPNLPCPYGGCSPPIDSKFEATFGSSDGNDWYDASQVDGWTLPYTMSFRCRGQVTNINCGGLSEGVCPSQNIDGLGYVSLVARNPYKGNAYAGCYSPCAKLTYANWRGHAYNPGAAPADKYCCAGRYAQPGACKTGPDANMEYTRVVHSHCSVYAWAYDDAVGLKACPSNQVSYQVTFYPGR